MPMMRLRCRLGWHSWVRAKVVDPTVEQSEERWETRCRYCGKYRRLLSRVGMGTGQ
jgi:hypothetical protein